MSAFRPVQNITTYNVVFRYCLIHCSPLFYCWSSRSSLSIIFFYQNYKFIVTYFILPMCSSFTYFYFLCYLYMLYINYLFRNFLQQKIFSNDLMLLQIRGTVFSTILHGKLEPFFPIYLHVYHLKPDVL